MVQARTWNCRPGQDAHAPTKNDASSCCRLVSAAACLDEADARCGGKAAIRPLSPASGTGKSNTIRLYPKSFGIELKGTSMSTFGDTIGKFKPKQRTAIRKVMLRWSRVELGREIVRNLNPLERFLPAADMQPILAVILRFQSKPITSLPASYRDECYLHTRQGGEVMSPKPAVLGRAVERRSFVDWLYKRHRTFFRRRAFAEDFVRRLVAGDPLTAYELAMPMSEYSAWVTWDKLSDPFAFAVDADHLRACLGLTPPDRWSGHPMVLLVYPRHGGLTLNRPTIADAGLHQFFEPPPEGHDGHGLTKTWPSSLRKLSAAPSPRPEAVHAPETMGRLARGSTREIL